MSTLTTEAPQRERRGTSRSEPTATGCCTTTTSPHGASPRSKPTARWCFASCTSTTRPKWRSASVLARSKCSGSGAHPEIYLVTLDTARNPSADYLRGTFDWHIDGMTEGIPIMATLLSAHAVADSGGETEFASTYAAYEELTDAEKARYEQVRVVHTLEASQRLVNPDPSPEELAMWRRRAPKEHPLVWRHRDGRRSLVLGATTSHVVGMEPDEGRSLLDDLLARSTAPDRVYRHEWAVGDLVIWDNRGVLHRALPYDRDSPRDMHRTTIKGDEAVR